MRTTISTTTIALAAAMILSTVLFGNGTAIAATTPAQKCESGKLKASGKYSSCMLSATAKSVTQSEAPDYSKCESTLGKSWTSAEEKGEGMCPGGTADQTNLKGFLDACDRSVAGALSGGALPLDVITCNADLGACDTDLATCTTDLGACDTDLATCTTELGTCNSGLGTCNTDLGICSASLAAMLALPHWTCNPGYYGANDGCDCGCGVVDPDCAGPGVANCNYCNDAGSCSPDGCPGMIDPDNNSQCGWTCNVDYYGAGDGCDCGCGLVDPDCPDATILSCNYCDDPGSCSEVPGCPGEINPVNNAQCAP